MANGGLFGGISSGLQGGIVLAQRQQQLKNDQTANFLKKVQGNLKQTDDQLKQLLEQGGAMKGMGVKFEDFQEMVGSVATQKQRLTQMLGKQAPAIDPRMLEAMTRQVWVTEAEQQAAKNRQALELERGKAAIGIEAKVTEEQLLQDRGLKRDPNQAAPVAFNQPGMVVDIKTGEPTGQMGVFDPNTGQSMLQGTNRPIPPGTTIVDASVEAQTLGGALGISEKDTQEAAKERLVVQQGITEVGQLLRLVDEAGQGVTGLRGTTIDVLGGLAGQINPEFEAAVASGLGGVTPQQVEQFRVRAQATVAKLVPVFTGEEGTRISDRELEISRTATGLLEPGASITQIRAALPMVISLKLADLMRQEITSGRPLTYDMATREGANSLGNRLVSYGMTTRTATSMLRDLAEIQRDLQALQ